ncbi:MAG: cell envelope integrity protein TolA [Gammaproteobacteria bacterium]
MHSSKEKYSKSFFFALMLHVVVLAVLVVSFDFSARTPVLQNTANKENIINAMVMSAPPRPTKIAPKPEQFIPPKLASVKPTPPTPPKPVFPDPVKPVKPQEKIKIAPPTKPAIAILDKKQKKLQEDKIAQQLLADIKKQTDQQKKVKQKAIAAAFEKEMKQLTAKSIQKQLQQEQKQLLGAKTQQTQGEVNKYKALILQAISQNWLVPKSVNKSLFAELLIHVAPGGVVLDVQIIKGSGDESLDHSARSAVFKSSPLPVPADLDAFDTFRQFVLKVKPENVLSSETWES